MHTKLAKRSIAKEAPRKTSSGKKYSYIVQKFGGESVDETAKVFEMLEHDEGGKKLAVVSAFSKITDGLFEILRKRQGGKILLTDFDKTIGKSLDLLSKASESITSAIRKDIEGVVVGVIGEVNALPVDECVLREDLVIGLGERIAARVVAAHCNLLGNYSDKYVPVDLADVTDGTWDISVDDTNWQPQFFVAVKKKLVKVLKPIVDAGKIPVITGYMGRVPGGTMALMGRGYSDATLMLVADALSETLVKEKKVRADVCKTVMGVLSADPKAFKPKTPRARKGQKLGGNNQPQLRTFLTKKTVARLAATGMKAVNAEAADILEKAKNVDATVRHTFYPTSSRRTVIVDKLPRTVAAGLKVIAHKAQHRLLIQNTSQLNRRGWIAQLLTVVAKEKISINVVDSTDNTCTILVDKEDGKLEKINRALKDLGNITEQSTVGWITCAEDGNRPVGDSNLDLGRAMNELYAHNIKVLHAAGTPGREVSVIVPEKDMVHAVRYLHQTVINHN